MVLSALVLERQLHAGVAASGGEVVDPSARAFRPLAVLERDSIAEALRRTKGNTSRGAAALGLSRTQFYTRLRRLGLAAQF